MSITDNIADSVLRVLSVSTLQLFIAVTQHATANLTAYGLSVPLRTTGKVSSLVLLCQPCFYPSQNLTEQSLVVMQTCQTSTCGKLTR